jgi:hypothetical protein
MSRNTKVNASSSRRAPAQTHLVVGTVVESADPYPRPPDPIIDFREIHERVESWKANISSTPLSQTDTQDAELDQSIMGNIRQPSQLDFPTVKQRRGDVAKAMKRKNSSSSRKDQATSRYFPAPKSLDAVNHDIGGMTTNVSQPRGSNVHSAPRSQHEASDENLVIRPRPSPTRPIAAGRESIQQVSEVRWISAAFLAF